jgi:hypothetical protein
MHTHEQGRRMEWPDGSCLMDQPAIAVRMLDIVGDELLKEARASSGK